MRSSSLLKLAALLVAGLFAFQAMAQTVVTGDISGTVTDQSNAVVVGATVTLSSPEIGYSQSTKTTSTGLYRFPLLKPANYKLIVSQSGFRTSDQPVTVAVGAVTTANIQLQVGQGSETIEVSGATPLIQTENANLQTSMTQQQIDNLPNSGNDLTAIAQVAPGVQMSSASGGGYGNFTAFGLPATSNLFTVNGNDEMDPYLNLNASGATNLLLGKNEVQEAAVVSNGYTGQYGRQAGAQVDYATISGSNQFHGNANYWWNGVSMNANDWFQNETVPVTPKGFVNNNQYAARIGGPIKKDKVFFFVDYEGLRYILSTSQNAILPSANYLNAVIANLNVVDPAAVPLYSVIRDLNANAPGIARATPVSAALDPALGCGDLTLGQPGFTQFGDPLNGGGGVPCAVNLRSNVGQPSTEWILAGRADINVSNVDKLFLRYRMDRGVQATATDPVSPLFNATSTQPQYEGQINNTRTINPATINSFIASGIWYSAIFNITDYSAAKAAYPYFTADISGSGWWNFGGLGASSAFPQGRKVTQYQFVDDLSMSRGSHDLKSGFNFRRNDITDGLFGRRSIPQVYVTSQDLFVQGETSRIRQYFSSITGTAHGNLQPWSLLPGFLAGKVQPQVDPDACVRIGTPTWFVRPIASAASWAIHQLNHDPSVPFNQMFNTYHSLFPNIERVAFQPRIGFAWNPWGESDTVIRGGVGLFTDLYPALLADSYAIQSPTSNRFVYRPGPMPFSYQDTANPIGPPATAQVAACNTAFNAAFFGGQNLAQYQAAAPGCATPDYNSILPDTVMNPRYTEWNVEVQHSFGQRMSASLNYVGNRGSNIFVSNPWVNAAAGGFGAFSGLRRQLLTPVSTTSST